MKKLTIFLITCLLILCSCAAPSEEFHELGIPIEAVDFGVEEIYIGMKREVLKAKFAEQGENCYYSDANLALFQDKNGLSVIVFFDSSEEWKNKSVVSIEQYEQPERIPTKQEWDLEQRETTISEYVQHFGLPELSFYHFSSSCWILPEEIAISQNAGRQMSYTDDGMIYLHFFYQNYQ